jgi:hypothetical protein
MSMPERPRKVMGTAEEYEPLRTPLELRCVPCGQKGKYLVGRICMDPDMAYSQDPDRINKSFGCTGYFHCKHCGAGGPWELTPVSTVLLMALMAEALRVPPEKARIHLAKLTLFDGTFTRWGTQAEAHLKAVIEKDSGNYFLWGRLGNFYKIAEEFDLALPAFQEAVRLEEHDIEALHSIAQIHLERDNKEEAARYFHQVLLHARHAPVKTPRDLLRNLVRHTLETLVDLHLKSNKRIPFFPVEKLPADAGKAEPLVVHLDSYDLSDERDWERMVERWMTGKDVPPAPRKPAPPPLPPPAPAPRTGWSGRPGRPGLPGRPSRNDLCPCGSGKKYKKCCGRA